MKPTYDLVCDVDDLRRKITQLTKDLAEAQRLLDNIADKAKVLDSQSRNEKKW